MQNSNDNDKLIYYDLMSTNYSTNSSNSAVNFQETRSTPIIRNPSLYNMSIIRFSIDTYMLPVATPIILLDTDDVNKTAYSVTLSYVSGGITIDSDEINLSWICPNQDIVKPIKKKDLHKILKLIIMIVNCE